MGVHKNTSQKTLFYRRAKKLFNNDAIKPKFMELQWNAAVV